MSIDEYLQQKWEHENVLFFNKDMLFKESFARGFAVGFADGFEEKKKRIARELKKMDIEPDRIALYLDLPIEEVEDL